MDERLSIGGFKEANVLNVGLFQRISKLIITGAQQNIYSGNCQSLSK